MRGGYTVDSDQLFSVPTEDRAKEVRLNLSRGENYLQKGSFTKKLNVADVDD